MCEVDPNAAVVFIYAACKGRRQSIYEGFCNKAAVQYCGNQKLAGPDSKSTITFFFVFAVSANCKKVSLVNVSAMDFVDDSGAGDS